MPEDFCRARSELGERIVHWGYAASRSEYLRILHEADLFVSTARHEFFGLAAVEAMLSGCYPVLPDRLAYPELLQHAESGESADCRDTYLYDGSLESLVHRLMLLLRQEPGELLRAGQQARQAAERFRWECRAEAMDDALEQVLGQSS